jgi:hypothetical protein
MFTRSYAAGDCGEREVCDIRQEIAFLEARLKAMGHDGDCAYERAMSTLYRDMLVELRGRLRLLRRRSA